MTTQPADAGTVTKAPRRKVLISDDQHDILTALSLLLKLNQYATEVVDSPAEALRAARASPFDLVLMDLNYSRDTTSGQEGLELISSLRRHGVTAPIVVMTAWGNVELAVEAMRLGASDFVQKPWDNQRLLATLRKQLDRVDSARRRETQARSELEIARHVQQKLFPQHSKVLSTLQYAAVCIPAREVGGDYYDFIDLGNDRLAGLLADVSGKGIAAAMLMANLQACFRTQLDSGVRDATQLLETVNRLFYASSPPEQYVTLFYFDYDARTRLFRYINCGHPSPVLLRRGSSIERLPATTTVLGLFPHCPCDAQELRLEPGDTVAIFSDGVTEFTDASGEEFGEERFFELVSSSQSLNADAAVRHVVDRLASFRSEEEQFDDQTLVLLKVR